MHIRTSIKRAARSVSSVRQPTEIFLSLPQHLATKGPLECDGTRHNAFQVEQGVPRGPATRDVNFFLPINLFGSRNLPHVACFRGMGGVKQSRRFNAWPAALL
jgi:hypothetical protein